MERWKQIPNHPGYQISDHGRVRSMNGSRRAPPGYILRQTPNEHGYLTVGVTTEGKEYRLKVHQLVCEAFVAPRLAGQVTRHLDGTRKNNHFTNLIWGTHKENTDDARKHGTLPVGERVGGSVLTAIEVAQIRTYYDAELLGRSRARRYFITNLAEQYGVTRRTIRHIAKRITWRHTDGL